MRWNFLFVFVMLAPVVLAQEGVTLLYGVVHGVSENATIIARIDGIDVGQTGVSNGQFGYDAPLVVRGAARKEVVFYLGGLPLGNTTLAPGTSVRVDLYTPQARAEEEQKKSAGEIVVKQAPPQSPPQSPVALPQPIASGRPGALDPSVSMRVWIAAGTVVIIVVLVVGLLLYKHAQRAPVELESYVQRMLQAGYQPMQITTALRQQGWSEGDIARVLRR